MSIQESKDDNEPGKEEKYIYYYVSQSNKVRRELVDWDLYNPGVWCGINRTFVHKWMSKPFPKFISTKKNKKFETLITWKKKHINLFDNGNKLIKKKIQLVVIHSWDENAISSFEQKRF